MALVYLNGEYLAEEEARVPVLDRGFIFGDAIYEVIPSYGGQPFRLEEHLRRLRNNLQDVRISNPLTNKQWSDIFTAVMAQNGDKDQALYCQVTRGVAPRDHALPGDIAPTIFVMANIMQPISADLLKKGIGVITCADIRWANCHIKTTSLLANVLLRQQAIDKGAMEAILIRDGYVTEGAASNVYIVKNGVIITPPKGPTLLPGITRDLLLELAASHNMEYREADVLEQEFLNADEAWLSSSLKELLPITTINGRKLAQTQPGPVWHELYGYFQQFKQDFAQGKSPLAKL
ncbi:MAG: D-amino acid aminotransferase [Thiohalomonadales bacterium]